MLVEVILEVKMIDEPAKRDIFAVFEQAMACSKETNCRSTGFYSLIYNAKGKLARSASESLRLRVALNQLPPPRSLCPLRRVRRTCPAMHPFFNHGAHGFTRMGAGTRRVLSLFRENPCDLWLNLFFGNPTPIAEFFVRHTIELADRMDSPYIIMPFFPGTGVACVDR
jgi:hypothetical protein